MILAQQAGSKINEYPGTKLVSTRRYIKMTTNKKQNPEKTTKKKIWEKKKTHEVIDRNRIEQECNIRKIIEKKGKEKQK